MKGRVVLAMSGGVDSSVSAIKLLEDGYDVIGATFIACDSLHGKEAREARSTCDSLGIEHIVVDKRELFDSEVVRDFVSGYASGLTPNPCIVCNKILKYPFLMEIARNRNCDFISTGHYAIARHDSNLGSHEIRRASHLNKDQSYVLYNLSKEQLERLVLPLGSLCKDDVRKIAFEHGLASAESPDSQDICFIEDGDYAKFLQRFDIDSTPGDIVDSRGCILGTHVGLHEYTIGQRKGIGIAASRPYYVIDKDSINNRLIVGFKEECGLDSCIVRSVNWVSIDEPSNEIDVLVKTRYRQEPVKAKVSTIDGFEWVVSFAEPMSGVAPGQSAVFYGDGFAYDSDLLLGGGIIASRHARF